jgi:zinc transport system substrate-binding protein
MRISTLTFLLLLLITSCVQQKENLPGKPVVSVTILPQKYFVEQLAGARAEVNVMVPPGASPATYEPTVSQLSQLDLSALYIKMGTLGFELSWMDKICSVNPSMEVIDLSDGVEQIYGMDEENQNGHTHRHGGADPHIWMSTRNTKVMVVNMAGALTRLLPDDSLQIAGNLSTLLGKIDSLDLELTTILAKAEGKSFMIYHPSLSYFAKDYKLEQLALEWEGKTPSPSHMRKLTDLGKDHQITTIFVQEEFDSKNAEVLSQEIGAQIVPINPLDENWPDQMVHIATKLKEQW